MSWGSVLWGFCALFLPAIPVMLSLLVLARTLLPKMSLLLVFVSFFLTEILFLVCFSYYLKIGLSMRDGLVGKVHAFRLIYLNLSLAVISFLLVGIHKDWSTVLNLSTLPEDWLNLANFFFFLRKRKKR